MKLKNVYLTVSMAILTLSAYSQTPPPEFKDTSQTITKEELFEANAANKARQNAQKEVRKQNKADSKDAQEQQQKSIEDKVYSDDKKSPSARNNSTKQSSEGL